MQHETGAPDLSLWEEKRWERRRIIVAAHFDVRHDADDLVKRRPFRRIRFRIDHDAFADRILSLEREIGERLIDDDDLRGSRRVVLIEGAAAEEIDPKGREIIALHNFVICRGLLAWIGRWRA